LLAILEGYRARTARKEFENARRIEQET
jgi:hypothetical protein